jgi:hypothetical protein
MEINQKLIILLKNKELKHFKHNIIFKMIIYCKINKLNKINNNKIMIINFKKNKNKLY